MMAWIGEEGTMAGEQPQQTRVEELIQRFAREDGHPAPEPLTPEEIQEILSDPEWIEKIEQGRADLDAGRRIKLN